MRDENGKVLNERKNVDWNALVIAVIAAAVPTIIILVGWFYIMPYRVEAQAIEISSVKIDVESLKKRAEENKLSINTLQANYENIVRWLEKIDWKLDRK